MAVSAIGTNREVDSALLFAKIDGCHEMTSVDQLHRSLKRDAKFFHVARFRMQCADRQHRGLK